jgi:cell division transport system permease protein
MRLNSLVFLIREALSSLWRHGFMTLAAISTSAISFSVLGAFVAFLLVMNAVSATLLSELGVAVYMRENAELADAVRVRNTVSRLPGVASVTIVTRQQVWARMRGDLGSQIPLEGVKENPLTDELRVRMLDMEHVAPVAQTIRKLDGVADVRVAQDVVRNMQATVRVVKTVGTATAILLLLATLAVIANVIRLTVFARRREIRIMQLVGATNAFIRTPFVLEGAIYGLVGAAVAVLVVQFGLSHLLTFSNDNLPFLPLKPEAVSTTGLAWALLAVGVATGVAGSAASVRKFLRA